MKKLEDLPDPPPYKQHLVTKTSLGQKLSLVFIGVFLSIILLELILSGLGNIYLFLQKNPDILTGRAVLGKGIPTYTILTVGESTTAGFESSWPAQLEAILNNKSRHAKFNIINVARAGTITTLILARIEKELDDYKPDIVISMMGVNDDMHLKLKQKNNLDFFLQLQKLKTYKLVSIAIDQLNYKKSAVSYKNFTHNLVRKAQNNASAGNFDLAVSILYSYLIDYPDDYQANYNLAYLYFNMRDLEKAEKYIRRAIELKPKNSSSDAELMLLTYLYGVYDARRTLDSDSLIIEMYKNLSIPVSLSYADTPLGITRMNYQNLYLILKKRGIKYFAMQYPTKDIGIIKSFFSEADQRGVIFISNKDNFEQALNDSKYETYFSDNFAERLKTIFTGFYGHATKEGNRLIAENVANVILQELNLTS